MVNCVTDLIWIIVIGWKLDEMMLTLEYGVNCKWLILGVVVEIGWYDVGFDISVCIFL